jgi:hypothetical protein
MFPLQTIVRLVSTTLRRGRRPRVRPPRSRPSLESLPDRILLSTDLAGLVQQNLSQGLAKPDNEGLRLIEIPAAVTLPTFKESGELSVSPQQVANAFARYPRLEQLGTPALELGTVDVGGATRPTLQVQFGTSLSAWLVFGERGTGPANEPGSANDAKRPLLGGLIDVFADDGERRFLLDNLEAGRNLPGGPWLMPLLNALQYLEVIKSTPPAGDLPILVGHEPKEGAPQAETSNPPLATFVTGLPGGNQIAGGLVAEVLDDTPGNGFVAVVANATREPADILLAVDTVLPDSGVDLVRLHNADLAMVPTYVVGEMPAASVAPSREGDRPDLGLAAEVVGLEELPGDASRTPETTDQVFEQMIRVDPGRDAELQTQSAPGTIPAAAVADAGLALREWFVSLLPQGEEGAAAVRVLAIEGLLVYLCWRGWRSDPSRSKKKDAPAAAKHVGRKRERP